MQTRVSTPTWREPVTEMLGAGGFASVWRLGGGRVLKIAHASHELARARLAREAEALAHAGAPAVPRLFDHGVDADGHAWLVMEEIEGTTLADVTTGGPQPTRDVIAIGIAVLGALEQVHAAGFVHRDIKPDNLVRRRDGSIVILDLGLARKLPDDPDDPTRANVQVGSLEYIAPEQIVDSAAVDARADLYAFGVVMYELFAGRPPFVGDAAALERAHASLRPPRLNALANAPGAVEALVHECLQKQPERRPASAAEAKARLLAASHEPSSARTLRSVSMIREGRQPVVLLWTELPRVDRALLGMLGARRLVVVSQRGRRVLAGVLGGDHADPATVAIAAARDLAAAGARVALHLEALRVEPTGGTSAIRGAAAERPETWLPAASWTGVVLTRALASVTQAPTRNSELGGEFRALASDQTSSELVGRDVLLTDLAADAAAALRGMPRSERSGSGTWRPQGPAFAVLYGDAGVGKTAFATELARRLGELGARVHVASLPPPGTGKPGHSALAPLIGDVPGGAALVRTVGDALRAAARAKATAVILDDLHYAEHELLDALEYATLGGESMPLWVLGIASSRLEARRPQLGTRAERHRRDVLPPLEEDDAVALLATLLQPAEYPPLRALRRLAGLAHGNPLYLAMLAREIHERGAIRERPGGGGHFLDTGALEDLKQVALGPWLAARELAGLAAELVALARLCSILGGEVARDELVAIVDAIERKGGASTPIDVDVGLRELVDADILVAGPTGYRFRQSLVEEGIRATTDEDERRTVHEVALDYWQRQPDEDAGVADRVARHGEAVGADDVTAAAFERLGERAQREHRWLDAEESWSGALRSLRCTSTSRCRALIGRARARYRLQRMHDAVIDLEEAAALAVTIDAPAFEIEALIELGVVIDFMDMEQLDRGKEVAARARSRLVAAHLEDSPLAMEIDLADARCIYREQRYADAVPLLRRVLAQARSAHRDETATIASLMLGCALADIRELDEAEQVFDALIATCEAKGDRFHLAAAYGNRTWVWSARGMVERAEQDMRRVIQLAREAGQAHFERVATYNLAEDLLWQGKLDEALQLTRRSLALQARAGEGTTAPDRMLLARVLAARGDIAELRALIPAFADDRWSEQDTAMLATITALADDAEPARWASALEAARDLPTKQRLEVGLLAARANRLDPASRRELVELARGDTLFYVRQRELDAAD